MNWRKSSHSSGANNCVEAAAWRAASDCDGGQCVEAGSGPGAVLVRDSALQESPVLGFSPDAWRAFAAALKDADIPGHAA